MYALTLIAALSVPNSAIAPQCEVVSKEIVDAVVQKTLADSNRVSGIQKVGDLVGSWVHRCPIADHSDRRAISRSISRLLIRPELRSRAAIFLYQLGRDAVVARPAIRAAYLDEKRSMMRREHDPAGVMGAAYEVRDGLRCLDIRLHGGKPSHELCKFLEDFPNPERPTKDERG